MSDLGAPLPSPESVKTTDSDGRVGLIASIRLSFL